MLNSRVLVRMDSNSKQIDEKLIVKPAPSVTFCQRKKSGNGSFVSKLRNHFHEFIHASVDEHKTCLRNTIQKLSLQQTWLYCTNGQKFPCHKLPRHFQIVCSSWLSIVDWNQEKRACGMFLMSLQHKIRRGF
uniref:Uncharacterized protein LOC105852665 n=1 Tax=Cicer arietinum TaxID=3827 RepID=A0A3Q7XHJ4_CICAR|nr:uncharacterized protein LOC105852665 [Cicer arietinum]